MGVGKHLVSKWILSLKILKLVEVRMVMSRHMLLAIDCLSLCKILSFAYFLESDDTYDLLIQLTSPVKGAAYG